MPATSLMISHQEMRDAQEAGRTRPLSPDITDFVKYRGDWWLRSPEGWLRITDSYLASRFDAVRARLDLAEDDAICLLAQEQGATKEERS